MFIYTTTYLQTTFETVLKVALNLILWFVV